MKKIISIILGILLMFSMSITSFAYNYAPYTPVEEVEVPTIKITVTYLPGESTKADAEPVTFKASKTEPICGREMVFEVLIENNSSQILNVKDIVTKSNLKADFYSNKDESVSFKLYTDEIAEDNKDYKGSKIEYRYSGFNMKDDSIDGAAIAGKKGQTSQPLCYVAHVIGAEAFKTVFTCFGAEMKKDANANVWTGEYILVSDDQLGDNEDTSTSTDTSTPSEPESTEPEATDKDETSTSTTQPSTNAPEVTNPATPETEEPSKAPADVDDYIPDTGATVPFAAIGTLVTSAITALVAKKKKEN